MRHAALLLILAACVHAQKWQDLLLPEPRHIVGVVVDQGGQPVAEARIDHSNDRGQVHQTDAQGRFELDTQAPALVIRKAGFQSEYVRTQETTDARVTLRELGKRREFPTCTSSGKYDGIDGWGASFRFPKTAGVHVSEQGHDIDHGARSYYVDTKQGRKGIMHGSGPMWSFGTPSDLDVWRLVNYEEIAYSAGAQLIIDARGQMRDGNCWRYLGKFGESASYSGVDEATAKILDRFLDGACLPGSR
jgi:hypothetical protein